VYAHADRCRLFPGEKISNEAPWQARCDARARACSPVIRTGDDGIRRLFHEPYCPAKPGEPITAAEYAGSMPRGAEPWRRRR